MSAELKTYDLNGGTICLPEVLAFLEGSKQTTIICRCDYETAVEFHKAVKDVAIIESDGSGEVIFYRMIGYPFQILLYRNHHEEQLRQLKFDGIAKLVNFQPKFEMFPAWPAFQADDVP